MATLQLFIYYIHTNLCMTHLRWCMHYIIPMVNALNVPDCAGTLDLATYFLLLIYSSYYEILNATV